MKFIENYIDEIMDNFPINKITKKMRWDLLTATSHDFQYLIDHNQDELDAAQDVIDRIEDPVKLAQMIPNRHSVPYYCALLVVGVTMMLIVNFISKPDFLQIFSPTIFEFPDIIENFIYYILSGLTFYMVFMEICRRLPQKVLTRSNIQSIILLCIGTIMCAVYFSIAMSFVWFTFNGFGESIVDPFFKFMYTFYQTIIVSVPMTCVYSIINTLCFIFSISFYHLNDKCEAYVFENIYHPVDCKLENDVEKEIKPSIEFDNDKVIIDIVEEVVSETVNEMAIQEEVQTSNIHDNSNIENIVDTSNPLPIQREETEEQNIEITSDDITTQEEPITSDRLVSQDIEPSQEVVTDKTNLEISDEKSKIKSQKKSNSQKPSNKKKQNKKHHIKIANDFNRKHKKDN